MAYTTIDDPSAHFQVQLYSGNGGTQSITNTGNSDLQPDWVWLKRRDGTDNNSLFDSTRGVTKELNSNGLGAEGTASNLITSFDSDGFGLGDNGGVNGNGESYVSWQWKANGGTTSTNSDGSENSTVQANTTAGFSIVTLTANGSTETYGHGLGVKPDFILAKSRNTAGGWNFITDSLDGSMDYLTLQTTNTASTINYDAPTSTVFSYNDNNTNTTVIYCIAEKQGYSKFGKYTATGNANGPFIYLGFKPAFIMTKRTDTAGYHWRMYDAKRNPFNIVNARLAANNTDAEYSGTSGNEHADFLSNGFKWKTAASDQNVSGGTYFYMAFAENPFVTSDDGGSIPTTAR